MSVELEILSPTDKPALLGLTSGDLLTAAHTALTELGYVVHIAESHENLLARYGQFQYQIVILEESFGGVLPENNTALATLQNMVMGQRRHSVIILFGDLFESLNPLQAYQQSVHAVVNRTDMDKLALIVQQVVNDNAIFLNVFYDVQTRIAQGKR
jgi:hypothetical protein